MTTCLVDGDIVCFRAAFSAEDESEPYIACSRAGTMVDEILQATGADAFHLFLSGKDNFRYKVFPEYKANRREAKRPKWEQEVKTYFSLDWNAEWSDGCEADDMMGIALTELGDEGIIATIDKDLDMIPGKHYNFVKKELYEITPDQAVYNFYYQLLVGDTADGIKGVPGIGPKKAGRILAACESEREQLLRYEKAMLEACREAYGSDEEMEMNAKCLWIWRKPGDVWKWPTFNVDGST